MTSTVRTDAVALVADGAMTLEVEAAVAERVARWRPRVEARGGAGSEGPAGEATGEAEDEPAGQATGDVLVGAAREAPDDGAHDAAREPAAIRVVEAADGSRPAPSGDPTLRLGGAAAWVDGGVGRVVLGGRGGREHGRIDLASRRAEIALPAALRDAGADVPDAYSMLTIAAALLLGRLGRALVHAAAVIGPEGGAWLVAGDARSGKTTTVANLILAGRDWLSDDQVILSRGPASGGDAVGRRPRVEGWPRPFHLDEAWPDGEPTGTRRAVDPLALGPGRPRVAAPVRGLLFPRVVPDAAVTRAAPIGAGDALARLVRQSPWLLADPDAAESALELLRAAASRPAYALRLGRDAYADAGPVLRALADASASAARV